MLNFTRRYLAKLRYFLREDRRHKYRIVFEFFFYCTIIVALVLKCYAAIGEYLMQQITFKELIVQPNNNDFYVEFKLRKYYFISFELLNKPSLELYCKKTGGTFSCNYDFKTEVIGNDILYKGILSYKNKGLKINQNSNIELKAYIRFSISFTIFKDIFKKRGVSYTFKEKNIFAYFNNQSNKINTFVCHLLDYQIYRNYFEFFLNLKLNSEVINIDKLEIDIGTISTDLIFNKSKKYKLNINQLKIDNYEKNQIIIKIEKIEDDFDDFLNIVVKNFKSISINNAKLNSNEIILFDDFKYEILKAKNLKAIVDVLNVENNTIYASIYNSKEFDFSNPIYKSYDIKNTLRGKKSEINLSMYITYIDKPHFYISANITILDLEYFIYSYFNKTSCWIDLSYDCYMIFSFYDFDYSFINETKKITRTYEFNREIYENINFNYNITSGDEYNQYDLIMHCKKLNEDKKYIKINFKNLNGIIQNNYLKINLDLNGTVDICNKNMGIDLILVGKIKFLIWKNSAENIFTDLLKFNIFSSTINLFYLNTTPCPSFNILTRFLRLMKIETGLKNGRFHVNIKKAFPIEKYFMVHNFKTDLEVRLYFLNFLILVQPSNFNIYFSNLDIIIDGLEIIIAPHIYDQDNYTLLARTLDYEREILPHYLSNLINYIIMRSLIKYNFHSVTFTNLNFNNYIDILINLNNFTGERFTGYCKINRHDDPTITNFNKLVNFSTTYTETYDHYEYLRLFSIYALEKLDKYKQLNKLYSTYVPFISNSLNKIDIHLRGKLLGEIIFKEDIIFFHINIHSLNIIDFSNMRIRLYDKRDIMEFYVPIPIIYERKTEIRQLNLDEVERSQNIIFQYNDRNRKITLKKDDLNPFIIEINNILINNPLFTYISYLISNHYTNNIYLSLAYNNNRCCTIKIEEDLKLFTTLNIAFSEKFLENLKLNTLETLDSWEEYLRNNTLNKICLKLSMFNYATIFTKIYNLLLSNKGKKKPNFKTIYYEFADKKYLNCKYTLPFDINYQVFNDPIFNITIYNIKISISLVMNDLNIRYEYNKNIEEHFKDTVIFSGFFGKSFLFKRELKGIYQILDWTVGNMFLEYKKYLNLIKFLENFFEFNFVPMST